LALLAAYAQVLDLSGVATLAMEHSLCVEGEALKDLIRLWQVKKTHTQYRVINW
jgi:hypothetical protein